jgi:ABC-type dipeptide/oligopeptide/nickel transport system permease component
MFDDSQPTSRSVTLRLGSDHFFDLTAKQIVPAFSSIPMGWLCVVFMDVFSEFFGSLDSGSMLTEHGKFCLQHTAHANRVANSF